MSERIDPRTVVVPGHPWIVLEGVQHQYTYPGSPPARMVSTRDPRVIDQIPADVAEQIVAEIHIGEAVLQGLYFPECYRVHSTVVAGDARDHGEHWHTKKIELMEVILGAFEFTYTDPNGGPELKVTIHAEKNMALIVLPGTKHRVTPLNEGENILLVHSTTVHNDANPDAYKHWHSVSA